MGQALQVISGFATNPGSTVTGMTPNTGDSFTVRSFDMANRAQIVDLWALGATAGVVRLRSPRMHDIANGIRQRFVAATAQPLLARQAVEQLYSQDNLTFEISGGAAETDLASFLVYYPNIPGLDASLDSWDNVKPRIEHLYSVECDLTTGATVGQYGGAQAINASFDQYIRNRNYAILGYTSQSTAINTVGITGSDFGNLRVGGPGFTRAELTADWFAQQAVRYGVPLIPVFNSANVANINIDLTSNAASTAVTVVLNLALLAG